MIIILHRMEGNVLKWIPAKYKKTVLLLFVMIIVIATVLDIKYEGLFFQLLPSSLQTFLADLL